MGEPGVLASLIVVFREALEAGLVVGIVMAATAGLQGRLRWIGAGLAAGAAGAGLLAMFAGGLSNRFDGAGQEVFTASVLGLAVVMLGWHVTWMSAHARQLAAQMRAVGKDVMLGRRSLAALATVVGVAVLREGAEVVLFLYGIAASGQQSAAAMTLGGLAGLALAVTVSFALYRGLAAIPVHRLFGVTNILILLLAAGMAGQAAAVLHSADLIPGWGEHVWNTSWLIADGGLLGRTLHALVGYAAQPSGVQVAAWSATFVVLTVCARLAARPRMAARGVASAAAALAILCVLGIASARADNLPTLVFKQHRFYPDHITVPAGEKFRLEVQNTDNSADEFESVDLNREKLVTPGGKITVFLGPLDAGTYKFFGCFHRDTAQGVIVAK
ncbi:MAG TPA: FTR1 family protein [Acetobacteraceae bacterium]|nr:FTR1 family protein [Acetobacteraceae bacterium]